MSANGHVETIFGEAIEIAAPQEREAYLDQACHEDPDLRQEVGKLVENYFRAGDFLQSPVAEFSAPTLEASIAERPGMQIGPYKLLQQIGEGGFGVVFMAEQTAPVRRKVALKVIKPGMDTRQVIARFEAERQALAVMDHPNIARVLEAGATASGRPYFVMELVRGLPITTYCDEHNLPVRERLELFATVCQAIQHAHTKGIIHRDIKPSNVLVTRQDDQPVVKVIDFGIAKAMGQQLTEKTLFTEFAQMVGTPLYMSPEQAELTSVDIDTRSDIYSLGVLLYELLTGSTPVDKEELKKAALDEIRRIIREDEPQMPSLRLSGSETLPAIAAHRHIEPARLSKLVRGELDWIVMKALEKDRGRRYDTASGFAADVERYLADETVQACPPSAGYRFRKFAKRNRSALAATALFAISLLVALGGIASGVGWAVRDQTAREEQLARERAARQAKVSAQLELILDEVARLEQAEKWSEALVSVRRAEPALAAGEAPPDTQERVRQTLADLELVRRLDEVRMWSGTAWRDAPARQRLSVQADREYGAALRKAGIDIETLPVEQAVDRIKSRRAIAAALLPALDDWVAVRSVGKDEAAARRLIDVLQQADSDPWRRQMRDALARQDWPALNKLATLEDLDRQPAATLSLLHALLDPGDQLILRRAQWKYPADFWINHRLGVNLIWARSPDQVREGIGYMRVAVAVRPESAHAMMNLGNGYHFLGQYDQAIACYRKALEIAPNYWECRSNLGISLSQKGSHDEAIAALEEAIKLSPGGAAEAYAELSMIHSNRPDAHLRNAPLAAELAGKAVEIEPGFSNHGIALGIARYRQGQWQEARTALDKSLLGTSSFRGTFRWEQAIDWFFLAMSNWQLGDKDRAQQCYERAVEWIAKQQIVDEQLLAFQAEAEELLEMTAGFEGPGERRLAQANWYNDRAITLKTAKRLPEAEAAVRTAVKLKQQLVIEFPEDPNYQFHLAHSYLGLGYILQDLSRHREARQAFGEAGTILNELAADRTTEGDFQQWVAHTLWQLADAWERLERFGDAEQAYEKGLAAFQRLETSDPAKPFYREQQIAGYRRLAGLMLSSGRTHNAAAHYRRVVELQEKLASETPQDAGYRNDLAGTFAYLGLALERDQRRPEAEEAHGKALALWKQLSEEHPDHEWYRRERAYFSLGLAGFLQSAGRPEDALEHCRTSVRLNEQLLADFAGKRDYQPRLEHGRGVLISLLCSLGHVEEAGKEIDALLSAGPQGDELNNIAQAIVSRPDTSADAARRAVELAKKAVQMNVSEGCVWNTLGVAQYRAQNWKDAVAALEKSRETRNGGDSSDWFFLAMAHWQLDEKEQARKWYDQAVAWVEKNAQGNEELRRFRAEAEELMGVKETKM